MMKKWIFGAASAALLASGLFFSCANSDDYDDETTKEEIVSLATLVGGSYSFTAGTATHTLSFVSETEATYAIPAYNIFQYFTYTAEESGSNEYTLKMYAHEEGETVDTATTTAEARSYVITINSFSEILIGTTTASLASPTDLIGKSYSFTAGPSTHILSFASNTELAYSMTGSWGGASYIFTYKTLVNSDGSYTFSMYQHYADTEADLTASANRTSTITINDDSTILIGTTSASLYTDYASLGSTLYAGSWHTDAWTVYSVTADATVTVGESELSYASESMSSMTGSYENVWWTINEYGYFVCKGAHSDEDESADNAKAYVTFKPVLGDSSSATTYGYFTVVAHGDTEAELIKVTSAE